MASDRVLYDLAISLSSSQPSVLVGGLVSSQGPSLHVSRVRRAVTKADV